MQEKIPNWEKFPVRLASTGTTRVWLRWPAGWAQAEIGERFGVDDTTVSKDLKNSQLGKIAGSLGEHWAEGVA